LTIIVNFLAQSRGDPLAHKAVVTADLARMVAEGAPTQKVVRAKTPAEVAPLGRARRRARIGHRARPWPYRAALPERLAERPLHVRRRLRRDPRPRHHARARRGEPYGDEVRSDRFRAQFQGKTAGDPITAGKDIDIVSGATISSRSMALGVKRDALILQTALKNGSL
jgi:hypothetical protein